MTSSHLEPPCSAATHRVERTGLDRFRLGLWYASSGTAGCVPRAAQVAIAAFGRCRLSHSNEAGGDRSLLRSRLVDRDSETASNCMAAIAYDDVSRLALVELHNAIGRARNSGDTVSKVDRCGASEARRGASPTGHGWVSSEDDTTGQTKRDPSDPQTTGAKSRSQSISLRRGAAAQRCRSRPEIPRIPELGTLRIQAKGLTPHDRTTVGNRGVTRSTKSACSRLN